MNIFSAIKQAVVGVVDQQRAKHIVNDIRRNLNGQVFGVAVREFLNNDTTVKDSVKAEVLRRVRNEREFASGIEKVDKAAKLMIKGLDTAIYAHVTSLEMIRHIDAKEHRIKALDHEYKAIQLEQSGRSLHDYQVRDCAEKLQEHVDSLTFAQKQLNKVSVQEEAAHRDIKATRPLLKYIKATEAGDRWLKLWTRQYDSKIETKTKQFMAMGIKASVVKAPKEIVHPDLVGINSVSAGKDQTGLAIPLIPTSAPFIKPPVVTETVSPPVEVKGQKVRTIATRAAITDPANPPVVTKTELTRVKLNLE